MSKMVCIDKASFTELEKDTVYECELYPYPSYRIVKIYKYYEDEIVEEDYLGLYPAELFVDYTQFMRDKKIDSICVT